ncbi:hypothetical protein PS3A_01390 [Pseudomonas sp. 3A(2025)]
MNDLSGTEAVLCRYRYDALDRLAGVNTETAEPAQRFYQKTHLSVEIQGAVRRSVFQFEDQLLAENRPGGSTGRSELLGTDGQRSVLHIQGGQGQQSIVYSAYGHGPSADALPGFNGERRDPLTGHYLLGNGYRAYNPVLMRFNQPDSLSPFGRGGLNAYAYCEGDPVNRRDPSGHISGPLGVGMSMFSVKRLSPIERLPGEILEHLFNYLPNQSLSRLSKTSSTMNWRVLGLSKTPRIDISDAGALRKIEMDVTGKTWGVMPSRLKGDAVYTVGFEEAAAAHRARLAAQIEGVSSEMQSIIDSVVRPGASPQRFRNVIADAMQQNAALPDIQADIAAVNAHYDLLASQHYSLRVERAVLPLLVRSIRARLDPR